MSFQKTAFTGLWIYEPPVFEDSRGYFFESYNQKIFGDAGIKIDWVQDNQSASSYGVIRGLHYQANPYPQVKLVRVLNGSIQDVVVDIRKGSPTYGKHFALELSAANKKQLFIPVGFAHGFSVLSEKAEVLYKCDGFYNRDSEGGIRFDDPALDIDWKIAPGREIVSEKDKVLPSMADCKNNFVFED
jgi:dTDP-4-dehydrorhamnose 3,5-epimerase